MRHKWKNKRKSKTVVSAVHLRLQSVAIARQFIIAADNVKYMDGTCIKPTVDQQLRWHNWLKRYRAFMKSILTSILAKSFIRLFWLGNMME